MKKAVIISLRAVCILIAAVILVLTLFVVFAKINLPGLFKKETENKIDIDVVYKTVGDKDLKLDIYYPTKKIFTKAPVIFSFHGGSWESGDKKIKEDDILKSVRSYGIMLVSVEYRLTDEETHYPAHLDDSADAVRFMAKNAKDYGADPKRFCVFGASAGGQISLMLLLKGADYGSDEALESTPFRVKCGVALCAPTDFLNIDMYENPEDQQEAAELLERLFGGTKEELPEVYKDASPINHVNKKAPPLFMSHGTKDPVVPYEQASTFYEAAKKAKMKIEFIPVENGNHKFKPADGTVTSPTVDETLDKMIRFLIYKLVL